jgi:hypothetical protein
MNTTAHPIKEFFTDSEWDLIYDLLESNRHYDEDESYAEDYVTALNKIHDLFKEINS